MASSAASLAANAAVAKPTLTGRVIAAWPSFALTASWELVTCQVHGNAVSGLKIPGAAHHALVELAVPR